MGKQQPKVTVEKVVVEETDHAAAENKARKSAADEHAATLRAQHVAALETELAFLERQPNPSAQRLAGVKAELDQYAKKPSQKRVETAQKTAEPKKAVAKTAEAPAKVEG